MAYNHFPKVESVATRKARANKSLSKLSVKNQNLEPIIIKGMTIAKSWWGKAWNLNLESYADYSNRIARGKSYVRSNAVLDLKIMKGQIFAKVQGSVSKPYAVLIEIEPLSQKKWDEVTKLCNHQIESLEQLVEGQFPKELENLFIDKKYGMFPHPKEIRFTCSCPDIAHMCKHIAATLYGVGARLDNDPMLFFELRALNGHELVRKSIDLKLDSMMINTSKKSNREIKDEDILKIFGV